MKLTRLMRVAEGDLWHARTEPHPELETWGSLHPELWAELRDEAARFWRLALRPLAVERERQEQARRERLAYVLRPAVDGPLPPDYCEWAQSKAPETRRLVTKLRPQLGMQVAPRLKLRVRLRARVPKVALRDAHEAGEVQACSPPFPRPPAQPQEETADPVSGEQA